MVKISVQRMSTAHVLDAGFPDSMLQDVGTFVQLT